MVQSNKPPTLTQANHVYLYRLLSSSLGCGRQTFITRVEETLASDRMTAEDLGFESTRALLEELDEFVTLTVFKGGRIYATIVAHPEWDEALEQQAKADAEDAQAGARARRRGRTKTVRAVKPRRVKREEEPEAAVDAEAAGTAVPADDDSTAVDAEMTMATGTAAKTDETVPTGEEAAKVVPAASDDEPEEQEGVRTTAPDARPEAAGPVTMDDSESTAPSTIEAAAERNAAPDAGSASAAAPGTGTHAAPGAGNSELEKPKDTPRSDEGAKQEASEPEGVVPGAPDGPSIVFTVTYDPYAQAQTEEMEPTAPGAGYGSVQTTPSAQPSRQPSRLTAEHVTKDEAQKPSTASKPTAASPETPPSPEALASYPQEFASEVYLPQPLDGVLASTLPYGESAMDALAQGYANARNADKLRGNRSQASFSFDLPESDLACTVRIKRRTGGGFKWAVCSVEFSLE